MFKDRYLPDLPVPGRMAPPDPRGAIKPEVLDSDGLSYGTGLRRINGAVGQAALSGEGISS